MEALTARPLLLALLTRRELVLPSIRDCRALVLTIFRLYCTNLPDRRIQKNDLRTALYALFSTYGTVLDVVAMKTAKMRGQAHIVFKDVQASTQALRALQGFEFFGKQMVCSRCPSIVAKPPLIQLMSRKSFTPKDHRMSFPNFAAHTLRQLKLRQPQSQRTSKSLSSVLLRAHSLHDPRPMSMERPMA